MENTNKNSWISWIVGVVIVIGLGYLVFAQKPANAPSGDGDTTPAATNVKPTEGEVVIGAFGALTGDAAAYGLPMQKAALLAAEEINAKGGVGGKKLVLKYEDSKCDGKEGATAIQKLINVDKAQLIFGGTCSGETLGAAPVANENKVVVVSPSASSPDITTKGGDYVFRFYPSDAMAGKVAALYAINKLGAKKAAILAENTDYAQGLRKVFADNFVKGGTVAVNEGYNSGTTDFKTQVLKIKNAGVDVVYVVPQLPASGINIIKTLRDQKIDAQILTAEILIGRELAKDNKDTLEGVIGFEAFFDEKSKEAAAFADAFKKKYNEDLAYPFMQSNAYSEVYLAKELIEKYGNDGAKMQQALQTLTNWAGGALTGIALDSQGDINWPSFSVKKIQNGDVNTTEVFNL